ncbi:MAG: hypothetical protein R3Y59_00790 [bacterium]
MLLLTVSEFRANISKYLKMAVTEQIAIKSKSGIFNISPSENIRTSNPSPSGDEFWNEPENLERLNRDVRELNKVDVSSLESWDDFKLELAL